MPERIVKGKGMARWSSLPFLEHSQEDTLMIKGEGRSRVTLYKFGILHGHFLLEVNSWWREQGK